MSFEEKLFPLFHGFVTLACYISQNYSSSRQIACLKVTEKLQNRETQTADSRRVTTA
jgi:hypothetical protein